MKRLTNEDIADKIEETGQLYELRGIDFKPRAYARAAEQIASFGQSVAELYREKGEKGLREIPGVGPGIAAHIVELLETGTFKEYEKLRKASPLDIRGLTRVEHVGPKTALLLYKKLGVKDVAGLRKATESGKLTKAVGETLAAKISKGLDFLKASGERKILGHVLPLAMRIEEDLRAVPGVSHAVVAGSVRRRQETIGDLDYIVVADDPEAVMQRFMKFPRVEEPLEHGPTMTVVRLKNGMHADVRIVDGDAYGAILQHFTGSKEHNIALRTIAAKRGLKLNEYGLWKGKKRLAARTEEEVYQALGLPYIEPEIRTNEGELEAAKSGKLPKLIPYGSVRGDLQVQTSWTDGSATIEKMAAEARARGMEYIAVTDHTKALAMTGGLDEKRLAKQGREIDALNKKLKGFRVLKGTECDILKDGAMDLKDDALSALDFVGASVHSHFKLSSEAQTARIITAMKNPHVDCLFHPTGRIINRRPPYDIDMLAVLKAAKATGTAMEIDAYPDRSDLRDEHVRMAVKLGVKLLIDTDAHHPSHLGYLDLGVAIARRGWARREDVLNTKPANELLKWLKMPKKRRR